MRRCHKTINISSDIYDEINKMTKEDKFIFSQWVESTFREQMFDKEVKEKQIEDHKKIILKLFLKNYV